MTHSRPESMTRQPAVTSGIHGALFQLLPVISCPGSPDHGEGGGRGEVEKKYLQLSKMLSSSPWGKSWAWARTERSRNLNEAWVDLELLVSFMYAFT